jgi:small subunit ribosomal protein S21
LYQNRNKKGFRPNRNNDEKRGLHVEVRGDDVNKALRIFKKKVQEDGILQEYKERQQYTKPSEKRRKAKQAGRKRWLKTVEKKNLDTRAY